MPAFIRVERLCGSFLFIIDLCLPIARVGSCFVLMLSNWSSIINSRSSFWESFLPKRFGFLGGSELTLLDCLDGPSLILVATAFYAFYFLVSSCLILAFSILASIASSFACSCSCFAIRLLSAASFSTQPRQRHTSQG